MPSKTLREHGILLRSKRTSRTPRRKLGQRGAPIIGMVSIDDRPEDVAGRRVPGHWEGDLIIGAHGKPARSRSSSAPPALVSILALPKGNDADGVCHALIEHVTGLPDLMNRTPAPEGQGSDMARHAALTMATNMPVSFTHPHAPWERGTKQEHRQPHPRIPQGTPITDHQPHLTAITEEPQRTTQSNPRRRSPHAKPTNTPSLLPPLDTTVRSRAGQRPGLHPIANRG